MYKSLFGSEYFASGTSSPTGNQENYAFLTMRTMLSAADNFLAAENVRINPPKCCNKCNNCSDCSFFNQQLSWKASKEAAAITKSQKYNPGDKCWTVSYPKLADQISIKHAMPTQVC